MSERDATEGLSTDLATHIALVRKDLREQMKSLGLHEADGWRIAEEVRSSMSGTMIVLKPIHLQLRQPEIEAVVQVGHDGRPLE